MTIRQARHFGWAAIAVVLWGCGPEPADIHQTSHQLMTCADQELLVHGDQMFVFDRDDQLGMRLSQIVQTSTGAAFTNSGALWELQLRADGSAPVEARSPSDAQTFSCDKEVSGDETRLKLRWHNVVGSHGGAFTIAVDAHTHASAPDLTITGAIDFDEATSDSQGIWKFRVPVLNLADQGPTSELLIGAFSGYRIEDPAVNATREDGTPFEFRYPEPQFLPLSGYAQITPPDAGNLAGTGALVFVASHDDENERFAAKDFRAGAVATGGVTIDIGRLSAHPFKAQDWSNVGTAAIGLRSCSAAATCWSALGDAYRQWVEGSRVFSRPPLAEMVGVARASIDYDVLALVGFGNPPFDYETTHRADLNRISSRTGIAPQQIASIWYDWHDNIFDQGLPEHLPPRPGFIGAMQSAIAAGHRVTTYTNSAFWSEQVESYEKFAIKDKFAIIDADGSMPSHPHLGVSTDFGAQGYPELIHDYLYKPLLDLGVSGVLLDTLPFHKSCFAENHGHVAGGGNSFSLGLRELVQKLNEHAPGTVIFTEGSSESTVDLASGAHGYRTQNLIKAINPQAVGHVPLFDSVYRHRIPMISLASNDIPGSGALVGSRTLFYAGDPFYANALIDGDYLNIGWAFSAGHIVAHFRRPIADTVHDIQTNWDDPIFGETLQAWKQVSQVRADPMVKRYLLEGKLAQQALTLSLPSSELTADPIRPQSGTQTPSVFSYTFSRDDGFAVSIYNWTRAEQLYYLNIDPVAFGIKDTAGNFTGTWSLSVAIPGTTLTIIDDLSTLPDLQSVLDLLMNIPPRVPMVLIYQKR